MYTMLLTLVDCSSNQYVLCIIFRRTSLQTIANAVVKVVIPTERYCVFHFSLCPIVLILPSSIEHCCIVSLHNPQLLSFRVRVRVRVGVRVSMMIWILGTNSMTLVYLQ